jgi:subtilase family serine protease
MRWGTRTVFRWASICGGLAAAIVLPASSSAGSPPPVRVGSTPHLAREARVVGALPAGAPLHLTVVLKPRDPAGLASYAEAVSTPGSSVFHDYLTPSQFAERFGATQADVQRVSSSLRAHGLNPGEVTDNRLSIPLTATAGQAERAFSLTMQRMALPGGRSATVASAAPALDPSIAGQVQAVLGLSSTETFHPRYARPAVLRGSRRSELTHSARHTATGGPQPCSQASSTASQQGAYTADQIADAYGFSSLYRAGDQGQGQTIAIYELEPNDPNDIAAYQSCYGTHASVGYLHVDGGSGSGEGSGEAALDIENAVGLAPGATFLVYQGANSNSSAPGSGPYDTFSAIITQNRAKVVSVSWGECETSNSDGLAAESTLFQEAAAQGQSIVAASGDEGSEDCNGPLPSVPNLSLAVDDPSSQPFVTGVGGTTLSGLGPPPGESVWNNGAAAGLTGTGGAGGGGVSQTWPMPPYQSSAATGLHVIGPLSSGAPCGASSGDCREVPDVAMDSDPNSGYMVYWNGSRSDLSSPAGWQSIGGTSAAAPVWAALLALVNASSACHSSPVGFANPALYRAAGSAYGSDFHDVTSGNNDLSGTNDGRYPAGSGFDMATGLGTPIGPGLATSLCSATLRIANPGPQRSTQGRASSLQLKLTGAPAGAVTWRASRLPPGLSISPSTGRISGTPRRGGTYSVVVSGSYQGGPLAQVVFSWTVIGRPSISRASLTGVAARRPTLSLTVSSGFRARALKSLTLAVPSGLRLSSRRGSLTVAGARGRRVKFSSQLIGGRLQLVFASPQTSVSLRIRYAGISASPGFSGRVRGHRVRSLRVTVTAVDTAHHGSTFGTTVKPA